LSVALLLKKVFPDQDVTKYDAYSISYISTTAEAPEFDTYERNQLISLLAGFKNAPTSALFVVLAVLQPQTNPSVLESSLRVLIPTASDAASPCGAESVA